MHKLRAFGVIGQMRREVPENLRRISPLSRNDLPAQPAGRERQGRMIAVNICESSAYGKSVIERVMSTQLANK
jgi:hypothetical protein